MTYINRKTENSPSHLSVSLQAPTQPRQTLTADKGAGARLPRGAASAAHTAWTARGELRATVAGGPSDPTLQARAQALPLTPAGPALA